MKRKIVSIVMASAMVFGLAACGSSGGTTTSSSNGGNDASAASETTAKSESSDVVEGSSDDDNTLTVWTWDPNFNVYAIQKAAEIYAQDHEGFKVEVSEVQSDDCQGRKPGTSFQWDFHQDVYAGERAPYAELKWRVRRACAAAGGFGACRTGAYLCAGSGGGARDASDRRGSVKGFQRTRDRNDDGGQLSGKFRKGNLSVSVCDADTVFCK